ncbi:hypothetical protein GGR28_000720 [Lewinella aquimaris]|uniref:Uncharacterized protein n=1 Tax=Neolewinella aquimaris TaxID=1835722 RepID=A0A840E8J5_9BACT|nr:hypothetical protein [Neolewinella aquimaris]
MRIIPIAAGNEVDRAVLATFNPTRKLVENGLWQRRASS